MRQLYDSWADYVLLTCHILMYQKPIVFDNDGQLIEGIGNLSW